MGNNISTPSVSQSSFALATAITGYWLHQTMKPPQPLNVQTSYDAKYDRRLLKYSFSGIAVYRKLILGLSGLNAIAALVSPSSITSVFGGLAKYPGQVDPTFLTWNSTSSWVIPFVAVAAAIRLHAFNELGVNFTFDLHDPNRLITTGMYKYVQHPSYTSAVLSLVAGTAWFVRADGPAGALLPPAAFNAIKKWQVAYYAAVGTFLIFAIRMRVGDEEKMLRNKFGKEWEEWHERTPRFLPFLF